jgi:hypothetical protein
VTGSASRIGIFRRAHQDPMPEKRTTSQQHKQAETQSRGSRQQTALPPAIAAVLKLAYLLT